MRRSLLAVVPLCGLALAAIAGLVWLSPPPAPAPGHVLERAPLPEQPNLLVIVLDDVGTDQLAAFGGPPLPALDRLIEQGVLFRNAYTSPICTPSRVNILTGRHARRSGLGHVVTGTKAREALPLEEVTIAEMLSEAPRPYSSSAVGKWHVAGQASAQGQRAPLRQGFGWFGGTLDNLGKSSDARRDAYRRWQKNVNGELHWTEAYPTTDSVDDALARAAAMPEPWLLYVAFHAAHVPLHAPPEALLDAPLSPRATPAEQFASMVRALDHEVGRLLDGIDRDGTVVVVIGDNGTPEHITGGEAKGSVREAGVHVPLIVAHPAFAPRQTDALVHSVDLLPTLADLAAVAPDRRPPTDGISFAGLLSDPAASGAREMVYVEHFRPLGRGPWRIDRRAVRDARYKLMITVAQGHALYDLSADPGETTDLYPPATPETEAAFARLSAELDRLQVELTPIGPATP